MKYFKTVAYLFILFLGGCGSEEFYMSYKDPETSLYGIKNQKGKIIAAPQYEMIYGGNKLFHPSAPDTEYLVPVLKRNQIMRIVKDGSVRFRTVYFDNGPDYYEDGLSRFIEKDKKGNDKVGFHDRKGNVVIQPLYDHASPFRNGYAFVCKGCWAEKRKQQKYPVVSDQVFARPFAEKSNEDEYFDVKGGIWGGVDVTGKEVIPLGEEFKRVQSILEKKFQWGYGIKD